MPERGFHSESEHAPEYEDFIKSKQQPQPEAEKKAEQIARFSLPDLEEARQKKYPWVDAAEKARGALIKQTQETEDLLKNAQNEKVKQFLEERLKVFTERWERLKVLSSEKLGAKDEELNGLAEVMTSKPKGGYRFGAPGIDINDEARKELLNKLSSAIRDEQILERVKGKDEEPLALPEKTEPGKLVLVKKGALAIPNIGDKNKEQLALTEGERGKRPALDSKKREALPSAEKMALPSAERKALPPHEEGPGKKKVVFADVSEIVKDAARDAGAARVTEERDRARGFRGFFTRLKHQWLDTYLLDRETRRARGRIEQSRSIYAGELPQENTLVEHQEAMTAVMERFAAEEEGMLSQGESKEDINNAEIKRMVLDLVNNYARTGDETGFNQSCDAVLDRLARERGMRDRTFLQTVDYANNLKNLADEVRRSYTTLGQEGRAQETLLDDIDIIWARARGAVKTEAQFNAVDRLIGKLHKSRVGSMVNETTLAVGVNIAYSIAKKLGESVSRSKIAQWGTFFAGSAVAAGVAGAKENRRFKEERRQHLREMAQNRTYDQAISPRRQEMEQFRYETLKADEVINQIRGFYNVYEERGRRELADAQGAGGNAMNFLAELEARIKLADERRIDLFSYSDLRQVEQEKMQLLILRAQFKQDLAAQYPDGRERFNESLDSLIQTQENRLSREDIERKDALFKKAKTKKVAQAAVKAALTGIAVGAVAQELFALFSESQHGLLEAGINKLRGKPAVEGEGSLTALAGLAHLKSTFGEMTHPKADVLNDVLIDGKKFHTYLPVGVKLEDPESDGTFSLIYNGKEMANNITFDKDGTLSEASKQMLQAKGIGVVEKMDQITKGTGGAGGSKPENYQDYFSKHQGAWQNIKRHLWYDNNTPKPIFDKNELKLWWGGEGNTGYDGQNYVFNVKHMMPGGSYHGGFSVDAQKAIAEGKLKMLLSLSRDTENQAFEVSIDTNGNAIIPKDSELAKIFFGTDGNGHAIFKGKYAEVAEMLGQKNEEGRDMVRILATHVGEGDAAVPGGGSISESVPSTIFDVPIPVSTSGPLSYDLPPVIPVIGRKPLEPTSLGKKEKGKPAPPTISPEGGEPPEEVPPVEKVPPVPPAKTELSIDKPPIIPAVATPAAMEKTKAQKPQQVQEQAQVGRQEKVAQGKPKQELEPERPLVINKVGEEPGAPSAEDILSKVEVQGDKINDQTFTPEILQKEGLGPKYAILGKKNWYCSPLYKTGDGKFATVVYMEQDDKVILRSCYIDPKDNSWKYVSEYASDSKGKIDWPETYKNAELLPDEAQKALLWVIKKDKNSSLIVKPSNPDFIFAGAAKLKKK